MNQELFDRVRYKELFRESKTGLFIPENDIKDFMLILTVWNKMQMLYFYKL